MAYASVCSSASLADCDGDAAAGYIQGQHNHGKLYFSAISRKNYAGFIRLVRTKGSNKNLVGKFRDAFQRRRSAFNSSAIAHLIFIFAIDLKYFGATQIVPSLNYPVRHETPQPVCISFAMMRKSGGLLHGMASIVHQA